MAGCKYYEDENIAKIIKCYEPFRVLKKEPQGRFKGQFINNAQPDFFGINLKTGQSIVFEAKYTMDNKFKKSVISKEQYKTLDIYHNAGAYVGVCACLDKDYYFIPFKEIKEAKQNRGREYLLKEEIEQYKLSFYKGALLFLG